MELAIRAIKQVFNPLSDGHGSNSSGVVHFNLTQRRIILGPSRHNATTLLEEMPHAMQVSLSGDKAQNGWTMKVEQPDEKRSDAPGKKANLRVEQKGNVVGVWTPGKHKTRVIFSKGVNKVVIEETDFHGKDEAGVQSHPNGVPLAITIRGPKAHLAFKELKAHFEQFKE